MSYIYNKNNMYSTSSQEKDPSTNPTDETMLFLFHPDKLDLDSYCGCTIRTGIKISSAILLFIGISNFYTVIKEESYYEIISSLILSVLYCLSSFYLLFSGIKLEYKYAKIGCIVTGIIFYIDLFDFLYVSMMVVVDMYTPFDRQLYWVMLSVFVLFGILAILIELYIVWVSYCFMVHLKLKRTNVVFGDNLQKWNC